MKEQQLKPPVSTIVRLCDNTTVGPEFCDDRIIDVTHAVISSFKAPTGSCASGA
jgi:hypothetical protein